MANQPETPTFDVGVYQIEIADPVIGGVGGIDNKALLNLANRTAYLKQHMDSIESGAYYIPGYALLASPAFTGTPTSPTALSGNSTTTIANTAYVQNAVNGLATVDVSGAGNIVLTAVQYGCPILVMTGARTASGNVIFPAQTGEWTVVNNSTGAFTLTAKTLSGTGIVMGQQTPTIIFGDAVNISAAVSSSVPAGTIVESANMAAPTGWAFANGQQLSRTGSGAALFAAICLITSGTNTVGSQIVTGIPSTVNMSAGMPISGTNVQAATTILSVDSASQIHMSLPSSGGAVTAFVVAPYGVGDGSTTFNTPDRRSRAAIGAGQGSGLSARSLGAVGGEETHVLSVGELASHAHGFSDPGHGHGVNDPTHAHFLSVPGFGTVMVDGTGGQATVGGANLGLVSGLGTDAQATGISIQGAGTGCSVNANGSNTPHNNMQPWIAVNFIIKL